MRSGPGTSYGKVTSLNNGAVVNIVGIDNGWYKISTNGVTGYVSSDYMVTCKDSAGSRGDGATAVATASSSSLGQQVVDYAKQCLSFAPMCTAATAPAAFGCPGYTSYVYRHFGYTLNRIASSQLSTAPPSPERAAARRPGVLQVQHQQGRLSCMGIYIGGGQFIHASTNTYTVKIDDLTPPGHYANVWPRAAASCDFAWQANPV